MIFILLVQPRAFVVCRLNELCSFLKYFIVVADTRDIPQIDLAFAFSAAAVDAEDSFDKMKDTLDAIIKQYGTDKIRYAVITFGSTSSVIVNFGDDRGKDALRTIVKQLSRPAGDPDIKNALKRAESLFENASPSPGSRKILVIFIDKKSTNSRIDIKEAAKPLIDKNVTIVPAAVGSEVDVDEIELLPPNKYYIAVCPIPEPDTWPDKIIDKALKGK